MNGWMRTARATRRSGSGARATPLGCAATARLTAAARFRSRLVARFGSGFGRSFGFLTSRGLGRSFSAPASALSVAFFASCIAAELERAEAAKSSAARTKRRNEAERRRRAFLERQCRFTVLDPACGSGNFLYFGLFAGGGEILR